MARLSGHTGLKLSIRRLALYTRQRLLAVSPIVVAIGEVANSRVRLYLSTYLSLRALHQRGLGASARLAGARPK